MTKQELNYQTLQAVFPGECSIAGRPNVETISSGQVETIRTQHGASFDISAILNILASAAAIIEAGITVISFFKKREKGNTHSHFN